MYWEKGHIFPWGPLPTFNNKVKISENRFPLVLTLLRFKRLLRLRGSKCYTRELVIWGGRRMRSSLSSLLALMNMANLVPRVVSRLLELIKMGRADSRELVAHDARCNTPKF